MTETMDPQARKAQITATFDRISTGYDNPSQRFFPFAADYLLALAKPNPGQRVLDVATGTGLVAIAAAQAVRPGGRVQAIDLSAGMLEQARRNTDKHALDHIDYHLMDAERLEFRSDFFDWITCGFGVFFFTEPEQTLRSWLRVLRPGGHVIFSSFGPNTFQPQAQWLREAMEAAGVHVPDPAWQSLAEEQRCRQLVEQAGYSACEVSTRQLGYHLASAEDWWEILWNSGFRAILERLPPAELARFREAHLARVASLKQANGIWLDVEVIVTRAQKPAPC